MNPTDAPTSIPTNVPAATTDGASQPPMKDFCSLPGSIVFDAAGRHVGGGDTGQLPWLTLQKGFCAHHFAKIPSTREIRFGPNSELFAASPGRTCVGGASVGLGAVVMVPDDNGDGFGEAPIKIVNLETAHGFTFAPGYTTTRRPSRRSGARRTTAAARPSPIQARPVKSPRTSRSISRPSTGAKPWTSPTMARCTLRTAAIRARRHARSGCRSRAAF